MRNTIRLRSTNQRRFYFLENGQPAIISNKEFIRIFDIHEDTSRAWRKKERIPFLRQGQKVFFYMDDVMEFICDQFGGFNSQSF